MQTPPNINDQHAWWGQHFLVDQSLHPSLDTVQGTSTQEGQVDHTPQIPQGRVIASSSDTLFHPTSYTAIPPSYVLPDIPPYPHFCAFNHSPFSCLLPYPSSFSSYNNPNFAIPPHNPSTVVPNTCPLEAPPHVLPHSHPLPYPSSFSSYGNPPFMMPPHASHVLNMASGACLSFLYCFICLSFIDY